MTNARRKTVTTLFLTPAIMLAAACGSGEASDQAEDTSETRSESRAQGEASPTIPAGTVIALRLEETLSTSSHSSGDVVPATVTEPVHGAGGSVVVPAGARMQGLIEESVRSSGPEDPAILAFHFHRLYVDGEAYPVTATVENAEPRHTEGDSGAETAAKVAVGAAAGALLGQVLGGDTESTLKGAAAGTVAGAVVAITSRHGDATLEAGSLITVRTQEPIRLD